MAHEIFNNISISGIACAVPSKIENNMDYVDKLGIEEVQKFIKTVGVESKRLVSDKQTTSDLCFVAAQELIKKKQIDKESIDAIIFLTQSPDYLYPATSHVLHKRLQLSKDCLAFDINLGCSGYVYGLYIASSMLQGKNLKKVLFLAGEAPYANPESEVKSKMLFGDAGSATLIEKGDSDIKCLLKANGEGYTAIIVPGGSNRNPIKNFDKYHKSIASQMDGPDVFEFTITDVPRAFKEFFNIYGGNIEDYDYCVFHQANLFMLKHIAKKIKLPLDKMPISMDIYGNTSSATIPLSIVDLCERQNVPNRLNLITSGFGIGLSWGVVSFKINKDDILPIIITDDYFKEAF